MSRFWESFTNGLIFMSFFIVGAVYGGILVYGYTMVANSPSGVVWVDKKLTKDGCDLILGVTNPDWEKIQEILTQAERPNCTDGYLIFVDGNTHPEDYFTGITPEICKVRMLKEAIAWGECEFTAPEAEDDEEG